METCKNTQCDIVILISEEKFVYVVGLLWQIVYR